MANLTIKAELGSCLLHRKGHLTVDNCFLECADHPLDHLSCPIISTADDSSCPISKAQNEVSVIETRIEGGFGCVRTSGSLKLQQVNMDPLSLYPVHFTPTFGLINSTSSNTRIHLHPNCGFYSSFERFDLNMHKNILIFTQSFDINEE